MRFLLILKNCDELTLEHVKANVSEGIETNLPKLRRSSGNLSEESALRKDRLLRTGS
ncbi:hypothetical protein J21TS3_46020 [Paenibacillus cookii]|uniref:Uncharacterized protein n=1 Tax=Paenibacillus cookii TaxID=157839 RepID=A0ABQ4M4A8_9BACL|nr:hypothetical protein J21TS3_46020 [Paenibacillus cookii]